MAKERVDVLAYKQGLFETREQAKRGVMAGLVVAVHNGERFDKPGEKIDEATELKLKGEKLKYVSRGGLKLEKALDLFEIDLQDKVTLDIGASTGGFTDVMLQNGAALVYAVDVLVKPQFEAGREQIGKNGIIKDAKVHLSVLEQVQGFALEHGFSVLGVDYSPIQGGHGNIEFLLYLEKNTGQDRLQLQEFAAVVEKAHTDFKQSGYSGCHCRTSEGSWNFCDTSDCFPRYQRVGDY